MELGGIVLFIIAIAVVLVILKILGKSMKIILGVLANALIGGLVIWILNLFGMGIAFNWINALIVGFLGIPGVIIVVVLKFLL